MGQKVGGYRRNVEYGKGTRLSSDREKRGWEFQVNPKGRVGWNRSGVGRKERTYGLERSQSRSLRKELEEVRRREGGESNGFGIKGTSKRGYVVYGEYTRSSKERNEKKLKALKVAWERVLRKYEKRWIVKVDRKRRRRKERYTDYSKRSTKEVSKTIEDVKDKASKEFEGIEDTRRGIEDTRRGITGDNSRKKPEIKADFDERRRVLGEDSKRLKGEERCEAIALSGVRPTGTRRTNLIVKELENSLNHIDVLRTRESRMEHHAQSSQRGRKRLGITEGSKGGYYGYKVYVKGPLDGARRTIKYEFQGGTVPRGTKRARRRENQKVAKTDVGTVGVKVRYTYSRG